MGLWGKPGDGPGSSSLDMQGRAVPPRVDTEMALGTDVQIKINRLCLFRCYKLN